MKTSYSGDQAIVKTENSAYLHEATQSVVISKSSFDDQATHTVITANKGPKDTIENIDNGCEDYNLDDIQNFETVGMTTAVQAAESEQNDEIVSNIFVWGDNSHGQLAIPLNEKTRLVPDPVAIDLSRLGRIIQVSCGASHAVFLSEAGLVFAMGDNSYGQLGFPTASSPSSSQPMMVSSLSPRPGRTVSEVHCADYTSFALVSAERSEDADELYSWGSSVVNGFSTQITSQKQQQGPKKLLFSEANDQTVFKIKMMSAGADHAAIVTMDHQVHVWGDNSFGQLGLGDTQQRNTPVQNNQLMCESSAAQISCGKSFSFLISEQNEIMVSGRLPFSVQSEEGTELDYIVTFQSIAQFDQRVQILQVEASRFASLVVDPVEDGQPRELFFWGQSPLGVFNELTPLNQLFGGQTAVDNSSTGQSFNVKAVRNGLNFCVFIESDSGMTYQIGAENLIDPYVDDALVSLSELRDARFDDADKFACGNNFVIGESLTLGLVIKASPMKSVNDMQLLLQRENRVSAFKPLQSPVRNVIEEDPTAEEMSMQLVSPGGESKQSFPQRALYAGSISPSTPADANQSVLSYVSGTASLKLQHKELTGTMKNMTGCVLMMSETPKACHQQSRVTGGQNNAIIDMIEVNRKEHQFNRTGDIAQMKTQVLISDLGEPEVAMDEEPAQLNDHDSNQEKEIKQPKIPAAQADVGMVTPGKHQETIVEKSNFSPGVSPIVNVKMHEQASSIERSQAQQQCWLQMTDARQQQSPFLRIEDSSFQRQQYQQQREDSMRKLSSQLPLQMQPNQHYVYQSYTHPNSSVEDIHNRHQSGNQSAIACYLPVQQQVPSLNSTPRRSSTTGYHTFNAPVQMSYPLDQSGYLNMSQQQHQQHLAEQQLQQSLYHEMVMKEKLESTQLMSQLKEAQRQLEKSRKDYAKLLSQVDEDLEETAQLKDTVRQQEAQISELSHRFGEQDLTIERLMAEKTKFEQEGLKASKTNQSLQNELAQLQHRFTALEEHQLSKQLQDCINEKCRKNEQELEIQQQKRARQIYDLTVKLGCLQTENTELKSQLDDRNDEMEKRLDSSRILIEQELQEACEQIKDLSEAFSLAQDQLFKLQEEKAARTNVAVQTMSTTFATKKKSKAVQVGHSTNQEANKWMEEEEIPMFSHSVVKNAPAREVVIEMPMIPMATFGVLNQLNFAEANQSFEASISFVQHEQIDNSSNGGVSANINENSLREFKQLEQASMMQRQSMELPSLFNLPMAQRSSLGSKRNSALKLYQTIQTPRAEPVTTGAIKHNFLGSRSNASIEPRIIRNDSAVGGRTGLTTTSHSSRNNSRENSAARISSHNYMRVDQLPEKNAFMAASDGVQPYIQVSHTNLDLSIEQHERQQPEGEDSWQTFKPLATMTAQSSATCINDRYSLKRHQEIFMESAFSQAEDNQSQFNTMQQQRPQQNEMNNNEGVIEPQRAQKQQIQPQSTKNRRGKSNAELHSSVGSAQAKKIRRLRGQRKAEAQTSRPNDGQSSEDDDGGRLSVGAKSMMTTPMRGSLSQFNRNSKSCLSIKRDSSQLKQPTPMRKSTVLKATLSRIDSQSKLKESMDDLVQVVAMSMTSRNSQNTAFMPSTKHITPSKTNDMERKQTSLMAKTSRPSDNSTMRQRQSAQPNRQNLGHSHSQMQLNAAQQNRSTTPRANNTQSTLQTNNAAQTTRDHRNSISSSNNQLSATARRVAYEQRRKLAQQTMKEMKRSSQRTNANVNRQARAAVANLPTVAAVIVPENTMSISLEEEKPCAAPPLQSCPPVMSICEDSELPELFSARNAITIQDMSPIVAESEVVNIVQSRAPLSHRQIIQAVPQQQTNPFMATPVAQDNSLMRENSLDLRKSKTSLRQSMAGVSESTERLPSAAQEKDKDHLFSMKAKLSQIQSNKMMLESKIKDYETQLLRISHEPGTQEIMAKFKPAPRSGSLSAISGENGEQNISQSCSEYTLGGSYRATNDKRQNTQERQKKRTAFQPIQNNQTSHLSNNTSASFSSTMQPQSSTTPYRECMKGPPQVPQRMMKAPVSIQPRTHYKNQPIFNR